MQKCETTITLSFTVSTLSIGIFYLAA